MPFRASHRFARISATKVRPIANLVRGKFADEALDILQFQPHRGARLLEKVIRSALANAQELSQNRGEPINVKNLVVNQVQIDGGPMYKRIQPRARGMAYLIRKRMSHILVELEDVDELI